MIREQKVTLGRDLFKEQAPFQCKFTTEGRTFPESAGFSLPLDKKITLYSKNIGWGGKVSSPSLLTYQHVLPYDKLHIDNI